MGNEEVLAHVLGHEGTLRGDFSVLLCGALQLYAALFHKDDCSSTCRVPRTCKRIDIVRRSVSQDDCSSTCRVPRTYKRIDIVRRSVSQNDCSSTCRVPRTCKRIDIVRRSASFEEGDVSKAGATLPILLVRRAPDIGPDCTTGVKEKRQ